MPPASSWIRGPDLTDMAAEIHGSLFIFTPVRGLMRQVLWVRVAVVVCPKSNCSWTLVSAHLELVAMGDEGDEGSSRHGVGWTPAGAARRTEKAVLITQLDVLRTHQAISPSTFDDNTLVLVSTRPEMPSRFHLGTWGL